VIEVNILKILFYSALLGGTVFIAGVIVNEIQKEIKEEFE